MATATVHAVRLGYAVGTGEPVNIPLRHTAICGQTQEAGKTTALEGLITRARVHALTFVTKRGEGAFAGARRIRPYFREKTDWQYVASILEASRKERMRIERAWIIRASRGARTLAAVHANVKRELHALEAKGKANLSADMYLTLDAYLEEVVPTIGRVQWASSISLADGINVMDLSDVPPTMQQLVIASALEWVHERRTDTIVVVPEAWAFIPQGRRTPVREAAIRFIRQGASLRNYLLFDSQDLGGVDKELLRSVPVWILGVQREANEIKRTLQNIPASVTKPSPAAVATQELGQFFACWGTHAIRTYAQPAWMADELARRVATGAIDARNAAAIAAGGNVRRAFERVFSGGEERVELAGGRRGGKLDEQERQVNEREAQALRQENVELRQRIAQLEAQLAQLAEQLAGRGGGRGAAGGDVSPARGRGESRSSARGATRDGARGRAAAADADADVAAARGGARGTAGAGAAGNGDVDEATYAAIKARLMREAPGLLRVLVEAPELEVQIKRVTVTAEGSSTKGRVARLIQSSFLDTPRAYGEILRQLERTGSRINNRTLSLALADLVQTGFLTKEGRDSYQADQAARVRVVES